MGSMHLFERLLPGFVELGVNQQPALLGDIPDFAHHVVLEVAGIEIRPEPARQFPWLAA
jgi:hypothetical protein